MRCAVWPMLLALLLSACYADPYRRVLSEHLAELDVAHEVVDGHKDSGSRHFQLTIRPGPDTERQLVNRLGMAELKDRNSADWRTCSRAASAAEPDRMLFLGGRASALKTSRGTQLEFLCYVPIGPDRALLISSYSFG